MSEAKDLDNMALMTHDAIHIHSFTCEAIPGMSGRRLADLTSARARRGGERGLTCRAAPLGRLRAPLRGRAAAAVPPGPRPVPPPPVLRRGCHWLPVTLPSPPVPARGATLLGQGLHAAREAGRYAAAQGDRPAPDIQIPAAFLPATAPVHESGGWIAPRIRTDAVRSAGLHVGGPEASVKTGIKRRHTGGGAPSARALTSLAGKVPLPVPAKNGIPEAGAVAVPRHGPVGTAIARRAAVLGTCPSASLLAPPGDTDHVGLRGRAWSTATRQAGRGAGLAPSATGERGRTTSSRQASSLAGLHPAPAPLPCCAPDTNCRQAGRCRRHEHSARSTARLARAWKSHEPPSVHGRVTL